MKAHRRGVLLVVVSTVLLLSCGRANAALGDDALRAIAGGMRTTDDIARVGGHAAPTVRNGIALTRSQTAGDIAAAVDRLTVLLVSDDPTKTSPEWRQMRALTRQVYCEGLKVQLHEQRPPSTDEYERIILIAAKDRVLKEPPPKQRRTQAEALQKDAQALQEQHFKDGKYDVDFLTLAVLTCDLVP